MGLSLWVGSNGQRSPLGPDVTGMSNSLLDSLRQAPAEETLCQRTGRAAERCQNIQAKAAWA